MMRTSSARWKMSLTTSIREASHEDLPRIVELGSQSLIDGPYAGVIHDVPEQSRKCAELVMSMGKILLVEEDGKVVGLLGLLFANHHFSGQPYATELMWYLLPEYRASFAAIALMRAGERVSLLYQDMGDGAAVPIAISLMVQAEKLLVARQMLDEHKSVEEIASRYGMSPFGFKKNIMSTLLKHDVKHLLEHMQRLAKLDVEVKGMSQSKRTLVELAVLTITA